MCWASLYFPLHLLPACTCLSFISFSYISSSYTSYINLSYISLSYRQQRNKPAVPPKPKYCPTSGTYTSSNVENVRPLDAEGEEVRRRTAIDGNAAVPVRPLASSVDDPNLSAELELHLQQAESGHSSVREGEREKLSREREELLNRMKEKVRILRKDELEVEADMRSVREEGERLVGLVEEQSSFVEGDKVRVHLQEVERLITLLRVLNSRLGRTEKLLLRTRDADQKVCCQRHPVYRSLNCRSS